MRRGKRDKPRSEAPAPRPASRPPTVDEASRTVEQPAVPGPGEPEPSEQVLDELLSFFGVRHHQHDHGEPRRRSARPAPAEPPSAPVLVPAPPGNDDELAASLDDRPSPLPTSAAPESPSSVVSPPAPGVPASPTEFGLVRAPTKRQTRRSAREAKREQKAQEKRLAKLAKERKKAAKKAAKRGAPAADGAPALDAGEGVRIIPGTAAAEPGPSVPAAPVLVDPSAPDGIADVAPDPARVDDAHVQPAAAGAGVGTAADRATVSIGGDDDLPDAVYLESNLDGGGSDRGTVFIDDKDPATGAMVSMEVATAVNRMEPRLRDRRIAVKRAVGRKRLKWIALVTAAVGLVVAGLAVLGSGLFAIDNVRVEGAVYSVGPELDAIVADLEGENVLRVDTSAIEAELRRIPWVEDARVTTDFPHGATIELRERVPVVAYLGPDQKYRVLDDAGRVITVLEGRPTDYLELMVDAAEAPNLAAGALAPEGYRAAATLVTALVDPLRPLVESLTVDVAGTDLRMHLSNGVEVRFGAAEALQDKLVRLAVALTETDPEMAPITMIDVSTPDIVTE